MSKEAMIEQLLELRREQVEIMKRELTALGCLATSFLIILVFGLAGMVWLVFFLLGAAGIVP